MRELRILQWLRGKVVVIKTTMSILLDLGQRQVVIPKSILMTKVILYCFIRITDLKQAFLSNTMHLLVNMSIKESYPQRLPHQDNSPLS